MKTKIYDVIIAGAGLSGLCVAHFLNKSEPRLEILLLEKTNRPGGAIKSVRKDGFLAEWGPHGFLDNTEESRELLNDLGLTGKAQKAPLKRFLRYICLNGKLAQIPQTPFKIIKSDLVSFQSKLRLLADLWKKPIDTEQTIADWVAYRFGKAMLPFADIAMTGTYAGDIEKLSIDAVMPGPRRLELETGSLFRGILKSKKNRTRSGMPSMISFKEGLEHLVDRLAENKNISFDSPLKKIDFEGSNWSVVSGEKKFHFKKIVLALHINQALPILGHFCPPPKLSVPEAKIVNIVMGFGDKAQIPFGFGYLSPKSEKRFALGALFSTHMFPGRSPENFKSLEVLVGGIRNPESLALDDNELVERAYQDLKQLLNLPEPPVFTNVLRPKAGIPQLEIGHHKLREYRDQMESKRAGLSVCGFGWDGIGMNDMIKYAKITAKNLLEEKRDSSARPSIKGIYF